MVDRMRVTSDMTVSIPPAWSDRNTRAVQASRQEDSFVTAVASSARVRGSLKDLDDRAAREGAVQHVDHPDGLLPLLLQNQAGEGMHALVGCREGVLPGQGGRRVRATEGELAPVAGGDVAEDVHNGHGQAELGAGVDDGRGTEEQPARRRRGDGDG